MKHVQDARQTSLSPLTDPAPNQAAQPLAPTRSARSAIGRLFKRLAAWLLSGGAWETAAVLLLMLGAPLLAFHNLGLNPRPWNDEGAYLSLAKTLATDGVYAVRTSAGYETFGPAQSVGPTLIVPIALSFKLFGVGLAQGRLIPATLLLVAVIAFYVCGRVLFGRLAALLALVLLVASPATNLLAYGRSALGDVPALGFFLIGWLLWAAGAQRRRILLLVLAGLMMGAAMVTKTQFAFVGFPTLGFLLLLDLIYFRRGYVRSLLAVGLISLACVAAWWLWQVQYYSPALFYENAAKMRELAAATTGLTGEAVKTLIGPTAGYFYLYWGFVALAYVGLMCLRRKPDTVPLAFLWVFAVLWLACYLVLWVPTTRYSLAAAAITALFVGKLAADLLEALWSARQGLWHDLDPAAATRAPTVRAVLALGTLVALLSLALLTVFQLQRTVRSDVLDRTGNVETAYRVTPGDLQAPSQLALFLNQTVDRQAVIETWERELSVYTDHTYHYPDQSLLARTHLFNFHHRPPDYALGADYFARVRPAYVVIGWYARDKQIYDMAYLGSHARLIKTVGDDAWRYDVYLMDDV